MSLQEIETAIQELPPVELARLRAWFDEFCEDNLELTDEFSASIDRGKRDIAEGRVRRRQP